MKTNLKSDKIISALICLFIVFIFLAGLIKTLFFPVDAIYYENRPAETVPELTADSYMDGSFQNAMDSALSDQVHMAIKAKKLYNIFDYSAAKGVISQLQKMGYGYIKYRDIYFYKDCLTHRPEGSVNQNLDFAADVINSYCAALPDTEFYVFYIEHDVDIDFESGIKSGNYEYLLSRLALGKEKIDRLEINSFEQYKELFYKTDHHWNGRGADIALKQVCALLNVTPLDASGEYIDYGRYRGTKAAGLEGYPAEDFIVELYDYPDIAISANGETLGDYGRVQQLADGTLETVSYGNVFGEDNDMLLFDTGRSGENLLVLGDSYDNALLKPLSASFSKTYGVDYRAFPDFDMSSFVYEHDIDKVLFIGALEYFTGLT